MLTSKISKVGKVVICGAKGVGKTAILEQLIYGNVSIDSELHSTIEDTYVASVDTGKGSRDMLRIYDTAGLQGNVQLPRHYLLYPDAFILVYDPSDPASLDMLAGIKSDIDKYKEKKEMIIVVIANMRSRQIRATGPTPVESNLNRANNWCARERIKHYAVNAMERASLYEPFIQLAIRLYPTQTKSTFPQLRQLTQKTSKVDNS
ncbi:NF-kappa-B inhibitor-interacting Ras-like protein isoform X2 [Anopheles ziemanni]|uniref:NF-kappa-B inhibitor-interacting Ras-like protein isoform X2 n=1 Tax=Anopheles coustani TaxID=139045 RepID=UPI0026598767|nr:NF-kappa-B inhibitor-interacting Ras-like protein isoform X2 [Anopheles coustani]XP_058172190.1 NF-kappa-B inhibitor-interacting Ras-like protein isoform X2 [Anopheles ziemanni]